MRCRDDDLQPDSPAESLQENVLAFLGILIEQVNALVPLDVAQGTVGFEVERRIEIGGSGFYNFIGRTVQMNQGEFALA